MYVLSQSWLKRCGRLRYLWSTARGSFSIVAKYLSYRLLRAGVSFAVGGNRHPFCLCSVHSVIGSVSLGIHGQLGHSKCLEVQCCGDLTSFLRCKEEVLVMLVNVAVVPELSFKRTSYYSTTRRVVVSSTGATMLRRRVFLSRTLMVNTCRRPQVRDELPPDRW